MRAHLWAFPVFAGKNSILKTLDINVLNSSVVDPLLELDFKLNEFSIALNKGTLDTTGLFLPLLDYYGSVRVSNDTIDIGAGEKQIPTAC